MGLHRLGVRPKVTTPGYSRSPARDRPTTETTNEKGIATFQWDTTNSDAKSTFSVTELLQDGYDFVDANCVVTQPQEGGASSAACRSRPPRAS